jgi:hypothetical protein
MFALNKNYQELSSESPKTRKQSNMSLVNTDSENGSMYKVYTLDYIFKKIIEYSEDNSGKLIKQIAHWKLRSSENILRSLLNNA